MSLKSLNLVFVIPEPLNLVFVLPELNLVSPEPLNLVFMPPERLDLSIPLEPLVLV